MKISDNSLTNAAQNVSRAHETNSTKAAQSKSPIQSADEAQVGDVASVVSRALQSHEARVAELKQQYQNGTYKVDAAKVSAKIIGEHLAVGKD